MLVVSAFLVSPSIAQNNSGETAEKPISEFSECVAVELYTISPKAANKGAEIKGTTKIPEGWTLVGGSGGGGHPTMVICR